MCDRGIKSKAGRVASTTLPAVVLSNHKPLAPYLRRGRSWGLLVRTSLDTGRGCCPPMRWVASGARAMLARLHDRPPERRASKGGAYDYAYNPGSRALRLRP